jgi:hypothetical protein
MNPADVLRYGQATIDELIDRLRPDGWREIALGVWTAKDLVGHLGAFEVRFAEILAGFAGDEPATNLRAASPATFNDDQAAIRSVWTVEAVVAELREAHARTMSLVDRIPPETWRQVGAIPWYGPEYSLEDFLVYNIYGHKREHGPQLEAVLERSST